MAITTDPTYPVAGDEITLAITGATGSTAATRFELTSVPDRSALDEEVLVDAAGDPVQAFTPDAAGAYAVRAYDYRRFAGGPAYPGDPAGEARDELVAVQTGTVYVGDEMLLPIAGAGHSLTLRIVTHNTLVVEASLVSPTTEKARQCALDATVLAAVAALEGQAVSSIGEVLITDVSGFVTDFNAHLIYGTVHYASGDTANTILTGPITTQAGAIFTLNEIVDRLFAHITTNDGGWHTDIDRSSLPITAKVSTVADATVTLADARRVYAAHLATTTPVHKAADAANTLTADTLLTVAIKAVLTFFASQAPSTPTGESTGTALAAARYGFKLEG